MKVDVRKKAMKIGMVFIGLLFLGGIILMYSGNDAIALATEKKEGILTAEQVKVSFDSVSGRLVNEAVKEAQEVKKGDILMQLDSTDVDLSIEKLKAQIAQMDAQIDSTNGSIDIGYAKVNTSEQESFRQVDQQRAAVDSANATYQNAQLDYNRKKQLAEIGAISLSELDNASASLNVAAANVAQQQQALQRLLGGASDTGYTDGMSLPSIANQRMEVGNMANTARSLVEQKRALEVQLKELEVQKERLTLRAPEDGKILKVIAKEGEMVSANNPVILLESKRSYFDIYVSEDQAASISEGSDVTGYTVAGNKKVEGTIRIITQAPGFADLKQSREKGQADLSAFQIRIYVDPQEGIIPGMTVGVKTNEFTKR